MTSIKLRLALFNRFVLSGNEPKVITAVRRRALIAFLACQPDGQASREQLATLLWGDSPEAQARQSLRQALSVLRRELGSDHDVIVADREQVALILDRIEIDRRDFERLAKSDDLADLTTAAAMAADNFLADLGVDVASFEDWLRVERESCLVRLCGVLERIGALLAAQGRDAEALEALGRLDTLRPGRIGLARQIETLRARASGFDGPSPSSSAEASSASPSVAPPPAPPAEGDAGNRDVRPALAGRTTSRWLVPALVASNFALLSLLLAVLGFGLDLASILGGGSTPASCTSGSTRGATRAGAQGWMHAKPGATCRFVGYLVPDVELLPDELRITRAPQLGQASIGQDRSIIYVAGERAGTDAFGVEGSGVHEGATLPFRLTFTIAIRP